MARLNIEGHGILNVPDEARSWPEDRLNAFVNEAIAGKKSAPSTGQPDVGRARALYEGALSGLTANWRDELAGATAAGELPSWLSNLGLPVGMARLLYEHATGNPGSATAAYDRAVAEIRATQKASEEQYPWSYFGGQVGGALAMPVGGAARAATLPGRMMGAAGIGAAYGGLSGAGHGETITDRATRGAVGTVLGAGIGAVAPPLIEGTVAGVGALASRPFNMIRGAINPQGAAERAVGRAYREALETDPNAVARLTPGELGQGPQAVLDTLGGEGRNLARDAANRSGGARDILNRTLDERFETQSNRFVNWLNSTFNFPNAHLQQEAIDKLEKTVNRAAYKHAYQQGDQPLWSPELERLVGTDFVQAAMREAVKSGKARAITQGYGGFNPPVTVTPDGRLIFNKGPTGVPTYPNLQFWDYTRRELSGAAGSAARAGDKERASVLGKIAKLLNAELDQLVPSYAKARHGAAGFFGAESALEAGQIFVTEQFSIPATRSALAKMSTLERQLFQDGFVSRYMETINSVSDRADLVRRIYSSPVAREKIEMALGRQRATELEAMVRVETIMQMGLRAVQGHSTTAMQLLGSGLAGAAGGGILGFDPTTSGVAAALTLAGKRGIDARVAQRVAEMLTSNNPAVLNRGIRMIANSTTMMRALRSIEGPATRVGAQQSAIPILGPAMPAISRAENEPEIPRPPRQ